MKAVAKASAEAAVADPALLDRALERHISEIYRKQENREAVAQKVIEEFKVNPPPETGVGPSDDWMNVFENYAANANSDALRDTWARVLAGEIRKPTSFSLITLQFLAVLDGSTAIAVEDLLGQAFDQSFVLIGEIGGEAFERMNLVRLAGLIGQLDDDTSWKNKANSDGIVIFTCANQRILAYLPPGEELTIHCTTISLIARQMYPVVQPKPSEQAITLLIEKLKTNSSVTMIRRGDVKAPGALITDIVTVWERPAPT